MRDQNNGGHIENLNAQTQVEALDRQGPPGRQPRRARRRWLAVMAAAAAVALVVVALMKWRESGSHNTVLENREPIGQPVWAFNGPSDMVHRPAPKVEPGHAVVQPVSARVVFGAESRTLSDAQQRFGEWVRRQGTLAPRIIINGQEHALKKPNEPLREETDNGYKLSGNELLVYNRRAVVMARELAETLFGVQDVNVRPGLLFRGRRYMETGEIVPLVAPRGTFAPVKLTVFGPPIAVDRIGVDQRVVLAKNAPIPNELKVNLLRTEQGQNLPSVDPADQAAPRVRNPASRDQYERVRSSLLPLIGKASYFSQETDTAHNVEELELKAGLRVSGSFGTVAAEVKKEEREEYGTVFARGVEVSYTIAVDDRPEAARWVTAAANINNIIELKEPLMYVSEVVYGRAWMVLATSSLTTSEVTAVLNGKIDTLTATLEPDMKARKKAELAATKFKLLNVGGVPSDKVHEIDTADYTKIAELIKELQKPALTPGTARPIAYRTRWLADDTPAGWVGVAPMQTFKLQKEPVKFDVTLLHYDVRKGFGGFLFFGGGGKLNIGARLDTDPDTGPVKHLFYRALDERDYQNINHPLISGRVAPGPTFSVILRQAELGGGMPSWEKFAERVGDGFGEQEIKVNLQELEKSGWIRVYTVDFPGNGKDPNRVTLRVSVTPPPVPELKNAKPLDVTPGSKPNDAAPAAARPGESKDE